MKQNEFDRLFPDGLKPNQIIPFVHKGKWAIHELLPIFFFLQEEKKISELKLLLDMNVKRHKLDLLLFAANITPKIQLSNSHMKVTLLENESWNIGIVGSANLNLNPRYEAGFIFTDSATYDYFSHAYTEVFENDSLPYQWE